VNERCCDRDEGFETLVGFARAHCYPSVFLQFAKVVFDQVPPFVGLLVELCREPPVGFWRYDRGYAAIQQAIAQPIRVKGPVRQQISGGQAADQRIGLAQIMGLPGHQREIDEIAERVCQGQYLRCYAAARASNGLAKSPPFAP
jgi:hypothetical protein